MTALVQQVRTAVPTLTAPLIFCLCPSSPAFLETVERHAFKKRMTAFISAALDETPGVQFLHYEQVDRLYPVEAKHDPEGERLGRIPYTELYYCALGTALVRYTHALFMPPFKVIALDCDNTLWSGICGEDGCDGVSLDAPRRKLQEFMVEQREAGMLLTMASKNNEQDVLDTFAAHPEMPLQLRHFTSWRLNWQPKPENLVSLSQELGLGLDSFIFVDDNPKECAELSGALPQVLTLALPGDIDRAPEFLNHVWAFDHPVVTDEDRNRNVYYAQQQEFGAKVRLAASLEVFMASLDLRVSIQPLVESKLPRAAQLTQRTNQFNLTTIRRTEAELKALEEVYTAEVSDRFGDYGLVGVAICKQQEDELYVDTFLLSCRVLGRGVEHRVAAFLGQRPRPVDSLGWCSHMRKPKGTHRPVIFSKASRSASGRIAKMDSFCACPPPRWQSCNGARRSVRKLLPRWLPPYLRQAAARWTTRVSRISFALPHRSCRRCAHLIPIPPIPLQ